MDECKHKAFVGLRRLRLAGIVLLLTMMVASAIASNIAQDKSNEMEVQPAPGASVRSRVTQDKGNEMEVQPGSPKLQSAGIIVWKGLVEKDGIIEIDGDKC